MDATSTDGVTSLLNPNPNPNPNHNPNPKPHLNQAGHSPVLLAEFAGHQHLLRASLGGGREVQRMASTRCSDNDRAAITLTRGKAALDA